MPFTTGPPEEWPHPASMNRLPELIGEMLSLPNSHLGIEIVGTNYYVQLAAGDGLGNDEGILLAEAVSNEFLEGSQRISPAADEVLVALGWQRPEIVCTHPGCELDHPNYYRFWDTRELPVSALAALLVQTLAVYGADEGTSFEIFGDPGSA